MLGCLTCLCAVRGEGDPSSGIKLNLKLVLYNENPMNHRKRKKKEQGDTGNLGLYVNCFIVPAKYNMKT